MLRRSKIFIATAVKIAISSVGAASSRAPQAGICIVVKMIRHVVDGDKLLTLSGDDAGPMVLMERVGPSDRKPYLPRLAFACGFARNQRAMYFAV
jgi:hypothetical protein